MSLPNFRKNKEIQEVLNNKANLSSIAKYEDKIKEIKEKLSDVIVCNEVFETIQCEWKKTGHPVVFIRTYWCNLRCSFANWGCDTPYTWDPKYTVEDDLNKYLPDMLVDEIMQYNSHNHWVITWGEPLLQQKKFIKVFEEYKNRTGNYPYVEVETNWTVVPLPEFDKYIGHYNVSTKLENSNATEKTGYIDNEENKFRYNWNSKAKRIKKESMNWFNECEKAYFKFVVDSNHEVLEEIESLQKEFNIPNSKVWLMPEWNTPEDMNENSLKLVEKVIEKGYKFTTRLHIVLWGTKRGV